jgi:hypothetical protein
VTTCATKWCLQLSLGRPRTSPSSSSYPSSPSRRRRRWCSSSASRRRPPSAECAPTRPPTAREREREEESVRDRDIAQRGREKSAAYGSLGVVAEAKGREEGIVDQHAEADGLLADVAVRCWRRRSSVPCRQGLLGSGARGVPFRTEMAATPREITAAAHHRTASAPCPPESCSQKWID